MQQENRKEIVEIQKKQAGLIDYNPEKHKREDYCAGCASPPEAKEYMNGLASNE